MTSAASYAHAALYIQWHRYVDCSPAVLHKTRKAWIRGALPHADNNWDSYYIASIEGYMLSIGILTKDQCFWSFDEI